MAIINCDNFINFATKVEENLKGLTHLEEALGGIATDGPITALVNYSADLVFWFFFGDNRLPEHEEDSFYEQYWEMFLEPCDVNNYIEFYNRWSKPIKEFV